MVSDFHIDAKTAYRVLHELKIPLTKFAVHPLGDHSILYSINFKTGHLFNVVRVNKPRRKLTFEQICELVILPLEAHEEWFKSL